MTDPAPPSIPPRQKPTPPPTTSARPVAASAGNRDTATRTATAAPAPARPTSGSSTEAQREKAATPPPPAPPRTAATGSVDRDPPTPLMSAVDKTTSWFKKAAGATTAAISPATTRPQSEDQPMTTTSTRPATASSPPTTPPGPPAGARAESSAGSSARPATGRIAAVGAAGGPRRVRLAISRIDPWSVMKLSFLMSVAFGILIVVAVGVVWYTLNGMHVFTNIDDLVRQVTGDESKINILQYVEFKRVISGATLVAVVDVFLLTALATIAALLYNIVAALVGGLHVTMTDE
jgi:hypothetical protein